MTGLLVALWAIAFTTWIAVQGAKENAEAEATRGQMRTVKTTVRR